MQYSIELGGKWVESYCITAFAWPQMAPMQTDINSERLA